MLVERRVARVGRQLRQIPQRHANVAGGADDLHGLPVDRRKRRPQHLVAPDDFAPAPAQRRDVERAFEPHRQRDVIRRCPRHQVLEEPHALLRERWRKRVELGAALSKELREQLLLFS